MDAYWLDIIQIIFSDAEAMWNLGLSLYILCKNTLCIAKMCFDFSVLGRYRRFEAIKFLTKGTDGMGHSD